MKVKIVNGSIADRPSRVVEEPGITVIPLLIRFGTEIYPDGIDFTVQDFILSQ